MTMPVDALTRGSAKPSEGTVMTQKLDIFPSKFLWLSLLDTKCMCYTGIQGLNYPELPSRGILGNKEIILFDCMCELCGYEWVWLLDELMSVCSVSDNFYTFF